MEVTKRYSKLVYLAIFVSYLLFLILPQLGERTFSKNFTTGAITRTSSKVFFLITLPSGTASNIVLFILITLILVYLAYYRFVNNEPEFQPPENNTGLKKYYSRIKKFLIYHRSSTFLLLSLISAYFALYNLDKFRINIIDAAYNTDNSRGTGSNFGNVAPYSWGMIFYWLAFILTFYARRLKNIDNNEFKEQLKSNLSKRYHSLFGPTFVQYAAIHISSLVFMIVSYGIYAGPLQAFMGPVYYQELILTYGLNLHASVPLILVILSYFTAPLFVLLLGMVLFSLKASGFAPNGPPLKVIAPEAYFYTTNINFQVWGFFSKKVPFANYYIGNAKFNGFYLGIVFASLVVGLIIGAFINYKKYGLHNSNVKLGAYIKFLFVVGFFVSFMLARVTAPCYISIGGIFTQLFFDRRTNNNSYFIKYRWYTTDAPDNGTYHPASTFVYLMIVWVPIVVILALFNYLIIQVISGEMFRPKENVQLVGKFYDESIKDIPFEKGKQ